MRLRQVLSRSVACAPGVLTARYVTSMSVKYWAFGREARQRTFTPYHAGSTPAGPTNTSSLPYFFQPRRAILRAAGGASNFKEPHPALLNNARKNSSQARCQRVRLLSPPWCASPANRVHAYRGAGVAGIGGNSSVVERASYTREAVSSTLTSCTMFQSSLGRAIDY